MIKKVLVKDLTIQILIKKVEELTRRVEKSEKENKILRHENVLLKEEIADLRSRLDSDSQNSNKPPSSYGYKKKTVKPALPKNYNTPHF